MTAQPGLFEGTGLDREFDSWRLRNADTVHKFLEFAREVKKSGRKKYGIKSIAERVRWHMEIVKRGEYRVNNNYMSRLARLLVKMDPSLDGLFEFRRIRS